MKFTRHLATASVLSLVAMAAPASAKLIPITYTGTVSSGYDQTGLFGSSGANLSGAAFVATYLFDTAFGTTSSYSYNDWYSYSTTSIYGGSAYGTTSPAVSATVTINGKTVAISTAYASSMSAYNETFYGTQYNGQNVSVQDSSNDGSVYKSISLNNYLNSVNGAAISPNFEDVVYGSMDGLNAGGSFSAYQYNYSTGTWTNSYANFVTSFVSNGVGAVPEPATWLMMICGLGAVGVALRRRKVASAGSASLA